MAARSIYRAHDSDPGLGWTGADQTATHVSVLWDDLCAFGHLQVADYGRVDTSRKLGSHVRGRALAAATVIVLMLAAALSAEVGAATTRPAPSLRAKPKAVVFMETTRLAGRLASGNVGVVVKLQRRVWPFRRPYKTVAKTHTEAHGAYSFEQRPALATEYRVVVPSSGATSGIRTVYVVKAFRLLGCQYTRPGFKHRACGTQKVKAGRYTLHITAEWIYPASVYAAEKRKPIYTYYGNRVGSEKPPRSLTRQGNVPQNANGASSTVFRFAKKVTVPRKSYAWSMSACTKTTEPSDGFGLPGAPGSHRCGQEKIPEKLPLSALG